MTTENTLRTKNIIVSYFIGPLDTDLRYARSLFNIVSGTPAPELYKIACCQFKMQERSII